MLIYNNFFLFYYYTFLSYYFLLYSSSSNSFFIIKSTINILTIINPPIINFSILFDFFSFSIYPSSVQFILFNSYIL